MLIRQLSGHCVLVLRQPMALSRNLVWYQCGNKSASSWFAFTSAKVLSRIATQRELGRYQHSWSMQSCGITMHHVRVDRGFHGPKMCAPFRAPLSCAYSRLCMTNSFTNLVGRRLQLDTVNCHRYVRRPTGQVLCRVTGSQLFTETFKPPCTLVTVKCG